MASSFVGTKYSTNLNKTVSRFVRSSRNYVDIPCPAMIKEYNRYMEGVDMAVIGFG